ncbi:hypothetical protein QAD02_000022 [Eretmocerus hayati]|uniref:Uncharacterized protein n=1 Tax=Eretmocerus hayati TaxID=131215 RepID=A0ACC2NDB2_9HYME|nr:hypothetical protein QAD02_000022 [Eretmocerus hayati]
MTKHSLFARRQITKLGPRGNEKYKLMWSNLADRLNLIGPETKIWQEWETFWSTYRKNCRTKTNTFKKVLRKTGHDNPDHRPTEGETAVNKIFGKPGLGAKLYPEIGVIFKKKENKTGRMNDQQKMLMIEFFSNHLDLMVDNESDDRWILLRGKLSSYGPDKDVSEWQATWKRLYTDANEAYKANQMNIARLTEFQKKIVQNFLNLRANNTVQVPAPIRAYCHDGANVQTSASRDTLTQQSKRLKLSPIKIPDSNAQSNSPKQKATRLITSLNNALDNAAIEIQNLHQSKSENLTQSIENTAGELDKLKNLVKEIKSLQETVNTVNGVLDDIERKYPDELAQSLQRNIQALQIN